MAVGKLSTDYLFDFIYLDRDRIASYYAQLFPDGVLTALKRTHGTSDKDGKAGSVGLPKVLGVTHEQAETVLTGLERNFDPAWTVPVQVINALAERGYVSEDISASGLGQVVLFTGRLQVIDLRMIQGLWEPIISVHNKQQLSSAKTNSERRAAQAEQANAKEISQILPKLPHMLQMRVFDNGTHLWGTMDPAGMTINPADLTFKHGPSIGGTWRMLCVLDAKPETERSDDEPMILPTSLGELEAGMLKMTLGLRQQFGRPYGDYGVTPIAIFRAIKPH